MTTTNSQMEKRTCKKPGCFKSFSVFARSPNHYCSRNCAIEDGAIPKDPREVWKMKEQARQAEMKSRLDKKLGPKPEEPPRAWPAGGSRPENGTVSLGSNPTFVSVKIVGGGSSTPATESKNESVAEGSTRTTRKPRTQEGGSGAMKTGNSSARRSEGSTKKTGTTSSEKSLAVVTAATQRGSSDASYGSLPAEASASMSLLGKSSRRLSRLLEECISDDDLDRSADKTKRVEGHRLETAVSIANAIAHTVQVQANLVKAVAAYRDGADE